jgi:uncharacterized membrane protein YphA (DoxX/SURF4 family)
MTAKQNPTLAAGQSVVLIRAMVGAIFLSEGLQKFLFAAQLGTGRFAKLGLPHPELLGPFVGATEIICACAILLGAWLRLAVLPLLVVISVAIATTKWPMLRTQGFWAAAHDGRADYCMVIGLLFLLAKGAGGWSVDSWRSHGPTP